MMTDTVEDEIKEHIKQVELLLLWMRNMLEIRGAIHDGSKLRSPEIEMFREFTPKLKELTFGSDEYKAALAEMGEALKHHYENNPHHPEYYKNGINGMSAFDLLEMIADWIASANRKGVSVNTKYLQERFHISRQLMDIIKNTLRIADVDYD